MTVCVSYKHSYTVKWYLEKLQKFSGNRVTQTFSVKITVSVKNSVKIFSVNFPGHVKITDSFFNYYTDNFCKKIPFFVKLTVPKFSVKMFDAVEFTGNS